MVEWRGKPVSDLSKSELRYALQDAAVALVVARRTNEKDSLFRGLLFGGLAGAALSAVAITFGLMI